MVVAGGGGGGARGRGAFSSSLHCHHSTRLNQAAATLVGEDRGGKQRCGGGRLHVDYGGCRKEGRKEGRREGGKAGRQAIKYVRVRTNQLLLRRGTAQGRPSLLFAV